MFKITRKSIEWGGSTLTLETGRLARQADGAVDVQYGGTRVLATVVMGPDKDSFDFLPLTVQFVTKSYSTGKIPGGFIKREGKPSDRDVLVSRLIDRSIRPLFPAGFNREVNVVCNLLSYDSVHPPEVAALIGVAAALAVSEVPFNGPVAGVKVGYSTDLKKLLLNAQPKIMADSALDLFLSGTKESVLMVESGALGLSEQEVLDAVVFGHESCLPVIEMIEDFAAEGGRATIDFSPPDVDSVVEEISREYLDHFVLAYSKKAKKERSAALALLRAKVAADLGAKDYSDKYISYATKKFERALVRNQVVSGRRLDGRAMDEVRPIDVEINLLSVAHGSALFTRGDTQALVALVLGTSQDEQVVDDFDGDRREHFMLHYNFPSYAVGEAAALRPPGRREIGHGKLACRAIAPLLPAKDDFPYTIRVVSEITESDGSSSMATVCAASLALMDAGVPIKSAVSGIAMGLIKEGDSVVILSDILGDEDHLGDMDFKVAGTSDGITALQMDMKISGISFEVMRQSLEQARVGRLHIMEKMNAVIAAPCDAVKVHAPRRESFVIDKDKIRNVIGSGGKNIREICEKTGAKIDIEQDGTILVYASSNEAVERAKSLIMDSVTEPEVGCVYSGVVDEIKGSFVIVGFLAGRKGAVHISEIKNEHISAIPDVVAKDDKVKVLVIGIDHHRVKLSMRRVDQETGEIREGALYEEGEGDSSSSSIGNSSDDTSSSSTDRTASRRRSTTGGGARPPMRHSSSRPQRRFSNSSSTESDDSDDADNKGNLIDDSSDSRPESKRPRFF